MFFDRNIELEMRYFIRSIVDESDYDYIVLMARKMYSLYRSFQIDESQTPIITSDAILLYSEELSGKKVLVVDDILIHVGNPIIKKRYHTGKKQSVGIIQRKFFSIHFYI